MDKKASMHWRFCVCRNIWENQSLKSLETNLTCTFCSSWKGSLCLRAKVHLLSVRVTSWAGLPRKNCLVCFGFCVDSCLSKQKGWIGLFEILNYKRRSITGCHLRCILIPGLNYNHTHAHTWWDTREPKICGKQNVPEFGAITPLLWFLHTLFFPQFALFCLQPPVSVCLSVSVCIIPVSSVLVLTLCSWQDVLASDLWPQSSAVFCHHFRLKCLINSGRQKRFTSLFWNTGTPKHDSFTITLQPYVTILSIFCKELLE